MTVQARTLQEALNNREAVLQGQGQDAHSRADGVAAADPVPEGEGVVGVDAELAHQLGVGADRDHVLGHRVGAQR